MTERMLLRKYRNNPVLPCWMMKMPLIHTWTESVVALEEIARNCLDLCFRGQGAGSIYKGLTEIFLYQVVSSLLP